MKRNTSKPSFATRLRNYSRLVSTKLELNRQTAGKVAAMSAAAGAALSVHHAADAAINYSGILNTTVAKPDSSFGITGTNINIGGLATFAVAAANFSAYGGYNFIGFAAKTFGTGGYPASTGSPGPNGEEIMFDVGLALGPEPRRNAEQLASGALINSGASFFAPAIAGSPKKAIHAGNDNFPVFGGQPAIWGPFPGVAGGTINGFAGVRFNTAGGSNKHYGWVQLKITLDNTPKATSLTVVDWAYETDANTAIMAGDDGLGTPGDFDGDNDVDGADFLEWQLDPAANGDAAGLMDWQNNYGAGAPLTAASSSVPEPGTATLLSLGMLATGAAGFRRHRRVNRLKSK